MGKDKVQDPRNPKIGVPRPQKQPLDPRRQTNTKNRKRSDEPETFLHTTRSNPYRKKGVISRKSMKCASTRGTRPC